jgi:hypothetical protein
MDLQKKESCDVRCLCSFMIDESKYRMMRKSVFDHHKAREKFVMKNHRSLALLIVNRIELREAMCLNLDFFSLPPLCANSSTQIFPMIYFSASAF